MQSAIPGELHVGGGVRSRCVWANTHLGPSATRSYHNNNFIASIFSIIIRPVLYRQSFSYRIFFRGCAETMKITLNHFDIALADLLY